MLVKGNEGNKKQPRFFFICTPTSPWIQCEKSGVGLWGGEHSGCLISPADVGFYLLRQLSEDVPFHSAPTQTCWSFPCCTQYVFAQLPPCWAATALSVTVVSKSWQRAQMSALGNVFVMLQFFISCFRTARMFLFAYVLGIMSPRELRVAFLYLFW